MLHPTPAERLRSRLSKLIYQLFRVCKTASSKQELIVMLRVAQSVTIVPEPIRKIINAIGYVKYEDKIYVPAVAVDPVDRNGQPTPRPENRLRSRLSKLIYQLFRVCKTASSKQELIVMLRVAQSVTIVPEPIRKIINAIGYVKYEDKIYVPAVAVDPVDRNGQPTPRPENVILSTLRRTVEYLSNAENSAGVRRRFHENNSIPGAIWNADHVLQNPDEIMPRNYDIYDDFRRESMIIAPFLSSRRGHQC
ncbi:unnamed protein product [Colias eurytheme]|nr:unnamed protein product [Colias eurytheme]